MAMRTILAERKFPVSELVPLASARSDGKQLDFCGENVTCRELTADSFKGVDLALFSAGGQTSLEYAPIARDAGCVVIDNSSAWRMDPDVPLVVPEVNPHDVDWHKGIIANPNCSTIQMVVVMKPLHDEARITRVVVSTYQAVSGHRRRGHRRAGAASRDRSCAGKTPPSRSTPTRSPSTASRRSTSSLPDGSTKEEQKMVDETKKIMGDPSIAVTATCVRVPVRNGHSEAVNLEFARPLSPERARELLAAAPGVQVVDDPAERAYPMPIVASGTDATYVGRIRRDPTVENGLNLWVVADNLRKGAALNAVQIAELLLERDLIRVP